MRGERMMRTQRIAVALAIALSLAAAQAATAQDVESPVISIESGFQAGYSLSDSDVGSSMDFALGFGLSDKLQAEVSFVQGDAVFHSYRLLGLSYAIAPRIGVTMLAGRNETPATVAGLGFYATILSRNVSGSLQTSLKAKLNYIAPVADYSTGVAGFGLAVSIGM
jgi:hypothetical protein